MSDHRSAERQSAENLADRAVNNSEPLQAPKTFMNAGEADELVRLLQYLPANTGFMISHPIEPPHTPGVFGGYHARVVLPGGGSGEAYGNNPAVAFRTAWARAHAEAAELLKGDVALTIDPKAIQRAEPFVDDELRGMLEGYVPSRHAGGGSAPIISRLLRTLRDWDAINNTGVFGPRREPK